MCLKIEFDQKVCLLESVREDCCASCQKYCRDERGCEDYRTIEILCTISHEVQKECPSSCGLCSAQKSNGTVIAFCCYSLINSVMINIKK